MRVATIIAALAIIIAKLLVGQPHEQPRLLCDTSVFPESTLHWANLLCHCFSDRLQPHQCEHHGMHEIMEIGLYPLISGKRTFAPHEVV